MNVRYAKYAPTNYTNQSIAKEFSICDAVDRVVASDTDQWPSILNWKFSFNQVYQKF